jgi:small ligand-binding sensory domain FIST
MPLRNEPVQAHDGVVHIGVGLSTAPDAPAAATEAALVAREPLGGTRPTLAVLVTSPHHASQARAVLDAVHNCAQPTSLVGCVAEGVIAGRREVEREPAVVVWLAVLPKPAETFHMEFLRTSSGGLFGGYRFDRAGADLHLLVPDPHTFPTHLLFAHLNAHAAGTTVIGGLAGGGGEAGLTRLFCDAEVFASGAVGVRLPGVRTRPIVSQGCRPIGSPYTVTGADGSIITGLAGRPPLRLLEDIVTGLPVQEQVLVSRGLHLGLAIDEYKSELARGDFLIRAVTGADEETGAIGVGDLIDVGTTVQFQVRDAATADQDLRESLLHARAEARPAGALLFTCNGRGTRMFDVPDHDAMLMSDVLGDVPLAGFFAAGELGPVGGRNFLHGFTASMALFDHDDGERRHEHRDQP